MELLEIILSHFFIRGKPVKRYRDKKTGRFVSGNMFRTAFGIKQLPLNHKYYGVTFYAWNKKPLSSIEIDRLYDIFEYHLNKFLRYGPDEWWFSIFEQANFEMKLSPGRLGTWHFVVDYRGVRLYDKSGDY